MQQPIAVTVGPDTVTVDTTVTVASALSTLGAWSEVDEGVGSTSGSTPPRRVFTPDTAVYPNTTGVTFRHNGVLNRTDSTGPNEGSIFHMWPSPTLVAGDVLRAEWTDTTGAAHVSEHTVSATTAPEPPAEEPPALEPAPAPVIGSGYRGPQGLWPSQFPAYSTPADIVTDGTWSGLASALSALAGTGGVIEHPGNISPPDATQTNLSGAAPIVVRPPLGQRADHAIAIPGTWKIGRQGVLLAGWRHDSGQIAVWDTGGDTMPTGVAWIECLTGNGGLFSATTYYSNKNAWGIVYEAVYRQPAYGASFDRFRCNGFNSGHCHLDLVGVWATGSDAPPPAHIDTVQVVEQNGGTGHVNIVNATLFAGWDKCIQGSGSRNVYTIDNAWVCSPTYTELLYPYGGAAGFDGYNAITSVASVSNSTFVGTAHGSFPVYLTDSVIHGASFGSTGGYINQGGSAIEPDIALVAPETAPTHEQLDAIWHP